jgi:hypothetical protein
MRREVETNPGWDTRSWYGQKRKVAGNVMTLFLGPKTSPDFVHRAREFNRCFQGPAFGVANVKVNLPTLVRREGRSRQEDDRDEKMPLAGGIGFCPHRRRVACGAPRGAIPSHTVHPKLHYLLLMCSTSRMK